MSYNNNQYNGYQQRNISNNRSLQLNFSDITLPLQNLNNQNQQQTTSIPQPLNINSTNPQQYQNGSYGYSQQSIPQPLNINNQSRSQQSTFSNKTTNLNFNNLNPQTNLNNQNQQQTTSIPQPLNINSTNPQQYQYNNNYQNPPQLLNSNQSNQNQQNTINNRDLTQSTQQTNFNNQFTNTYNSPFTAPQTNQYSGYGYSQQSIPTNQNGSYQNYQHSAQQSYNNNNLSINNNLYQTQSTQQTSINNQNQQQTTSIPQPFSGTPNNGSYNIQYSANQFQNQIDNYKNHQQTLIQGVQRITTIQQNFNNQSRSQQSTFSNRTKNLNFNNLNPQTNFNNQNQQNIPQPLNINSTNQQQRQYSGYGYPQQSIPTNQNGSYQNYQPSAQQSYNNNNLSINNNLYQIQSTQQTSINNQNQQQTTSIPQPLNINSTNQQQRQYSGYGYSQQSIPTNQNGSYQNYQPSAQQSYNNNNLSINNNPYQTQSTQQTSINNQFTNTYNSPFTVPQTNFNNQNQQNIPQPLNINSTNPQQYRYNNNYQNPSQLLNGNQSNQNQQNTINNRDLTQSTQQDDIQELSSEECFDLLKNIYGIALGNNPNIGGKIINCLGCIEINSEQEESFIVKLLTKAGCKDAKEMLEKEKEKRKQYYRKFITKTNKKYKEKNPGSKCIIDIPNYVGSEGDRFDKEEFKKRGISYLQEFIDYLSDEHCDPYENLRHLNKEYYTSYMVL